MPSFNAAELTRLVERIYDDSTAEALAEARQTLAHNGTGYIPPWKALNDHERNMSTLDAGNWLNAMRTVLDAPAGGLGSSRRAQEPPMRAGQLARMFHETYEELAPLYGYRTREASAKPWDDVPRPNRELMIATCARVLLALFPLAGPVSPAPQPEESPVPHRAQEPDAFGQVAAWLRSGDVAEDVEDFLEAHYAAWPDTAVTSPHQAASMRVLGVLADRVEANNITAIMVQPKTDTKANLRTLAEVRGPGPGLPQVLAERLAQADAQEPAPTTEAHPTVAIARALRAHAGRRADEIRRLAETLDDGAEFLAAVQELMADHWEAMAVEALAAIRRQRLVLR